MAAFVIGAETLALGALRTLVGGSGGGSLGGGGRRRFAGGNALTNCGPEPTQITVVINHINSAFRASTPGNVILNSLIFAIEIHKCAHILAATTITINTTIKAGVAEGTIKLVLQPTAGSNPSALLPPRWIVGAFRQPTSHPGGIEAPLEIFWDFHVERIQSFPLFDGINLRQLHAVILTELFSGVVIHAFPS